jgi:hypothetical protein
MLVLRTHVSSDDTLAQLGNPPEVPAGQRPTRMCSSKVQQPHRTGTTVAVPRRTTDLRQRPSMTALPLDGKERVPACGVRSACQRTTGRKLTATMTATTATSRDRRRALATIRALVMPQDLVNCHT